MLSIDAGLEQQPDAFIVDIAALDGLLELHPGILGELFEPVPAVGRHLVPAGGQAGGDLLDMSLHAAVSGGQALLADECDAKFFHYFRVSGLTQRHSA